jgi:hypothetical protein
MSLFGDMFITLIVSDIKIKGLWVGFVNKKSGLYVIYQHKEYKLNKNGEEYYIISRDPSELKRGFINYINILGQVENDIFMKKVNKNEIQEAYKVEMWARYQGKEFFVMGIDNGEVLVTTENTRIAKELNFTFVEPFVYDKHVRFEDLDEIIEKQEKIYLD